MARKRTTSKPSAPDRTTKRTSGRASGWAMRELPPEIRAELRDRVAEAKRGRTLIPADQALDEADRMAEEIIEILNRPITRRNAS